MRRLWMVAMSVMLLLVACGGDGGEADEEGATTAPQTASQNDESATTTTTEIPKAENEDGTTAETSSPASEVSVAVVTLDDATYEFRSTGFAAETCSTTGFTRIVLYMADENGELLMIDDKTAGVVSIFPDAVEVDLTAEGQKWIADSSRTGVEESSVDSFSAEGNQVQGTATFYTLGGDGPVDGSFEVTCAS